MFKTEAERSVSARVLIEVSGRPVPYAAKYAAEGAMRMRRRRAIHQNRAPPKTAMRRSAAMTPAAIIPVSLFFAPDDSFVISPELPVG